MTAIRDPSADAMVSAVHVLPDPDGPSRATRALDCSLVAGLN
jgi:hypothetical protein